ncbi:MAG: SAM-dependent methyltransferase, partial [Gammaproteobacteria bacterium]
MNSVSPIGNLSAVDPERNKNTADAWFAGLLEKNLLPDALIRIGIRRLLARRLRDEDAGDVERQQAKLVDWVGALKQSPIAVHTEAANAQHYEVPAAFFRKLLGSRLKYSACLWPDGVSTLDGAEEAMLKLVCERARLADGQTVLDLGCGWGSFSLYAAERFPRSQFVGISNS